MIKNDLKRCKTTEKSEVLPNDGPTNGASHRDACTQLKSANLLPVYCHSVIINLLYHPLKFPSLSQCLVPYSGLDISIFDVLCLLLILYF